MNKVRDPINTPLKCETSGNFNKNIFSEDTFDKLQKHLLLLIISLFFYHLIFSEKQQSDLPKEKKTHRVDYQPKKKAPKPMQIIRQGRNDNEINVEENDPLASGALTLIK
jgi:hypothetical protein